MEEKVLELKTGLADFKTREENYNSILEIARGRHSVLQTEINKHEQKAEAYNKLTQNLTDLKERYDGLEDDVKRIGDDQQEQEKRLDSIASEIEGQEDLQSQAESKKTNIKDELSNILPIAEDYPRQRDQVKEKITAAKTQKQILTDEKESIAGGSCPIKENTCPLASVENKEKKKKTINTKLFKLNIVLKRQLKDLEIIEDGIEREEKQNEYEKFLKLQLAQGDSALNESKILIGQLNTREKESQRFIKKLEEQYERATDECRDAVEDIKKTKEEIAEMKIVDASELIKEQNKLTIEIEDKVEALDDIKTKYIKAESSIEEIGKRIEEFVEMKKNHEKLCDDQRTYKYIVKMLTKEIPHQLIEAALPEIEGYAQEFISDLSNGRMGLYFVTQKELKKKDKETKENLKSDGLELELDIDGNRKKYALCSGGERTRGDIAIHLAYAVFLLNRSGAKLESLFLDEVASSLDRDGKQNLINLLNKLISEYGFKMIFLISQDDRLNKLFDNIITIHKTSEGSKICYQSKTMDQESA